MCLSSMSSRPREQPSNDRQALGGRGAASRSKRSWERTSRSGSVWAKAASCAGHRFRDVLAVPQQADRPAANVGVAMCRRSRVAASSSNLPDRLSAQRASRAWGLSRSSPASSEAGDQGFVATIAQHEQGLTSLPLVPMFEHGDELLAAQLGQVEGARSGGSPSPASGRVVRSPCASCPGGRREAQAGCRTSPAI